MLNSSKAAQIEELLRHKDLAPVISELEKLHDLDDEDETGQTPLILAVIYHNLPAVTYLINNGADPNKADFAGLNAIMYAQLNGNKALERALSAS